MVAAGAILWIDGGGSQVNDTNELYFRIVAIGRMSGDKNKGRKCHEHCPIAMKNRQSVLSMDCIKGDTGAGGEISDENVSLSYRAIECERIYGVERRNK